MNYNAKEWLSIRANAINWFTAKPEHYLRGSWTDRSVSPSNELWGYFSRGGGPRHPPRPWARESRGITPFGKASRKRSVGATGAQAIARRFKIIQNGTGNTLASESLSRVVCFWLGIRKGSEEMRWSCWHFYTSERRESRRHATSIDPLCMPSPNSPLHFRPAFYPLRLFFGRSRNPGSNEKYASFAPPGKGLRKIPNGFDDTGLCYNRRISLRSWVSKVLSLFEECSSFVSRSLLIVVQWFEDRRGISEDIFFGYSLLIRIYIQ